MSEFDWLSHLLFFCSGCIFGAVVRNIAVGILKRREEAEREWMHWQQRVRDLENGRKP